MWVWTDTNEVALLNGLTGEVIAIYPMKEWYKLMKEEAFPPYWMEGDLRVNLVLTLRDDEYWEMNK